MRLVGYTAAGLEDLAAEELEELTGTTAETVAPGRLLLLETDAAGMARCNYVAGSCARFVRLLSRPDPEDPDAIYDGIEFPVAEIMDADQTFAVEVERHADHGYGSVDAARQAGQKVVDLFEDATGETLDVDLDDPDLTFRLDLFEDTALFGIDTTGRSLNDRHYLDDLHDVTPPVLANLIVRASPWEPDSDHRLLDPLTRGGIIPIEAARIACRIPNSERKFDFLEFQDFDPATYAAVAQQARDRMDISEAAVEGSNDDVAGCETNAQNSGLDIVFAQRRIEDRPLGGHDLVIDAISSGSPAGQHTDRSGKQIAQRLEALEAELDEADSVTIVTDRAEYRPDDGREITWDDGSLRLLRW